MKKFLKNTSLFIITLMLIFGFSSNVNAAAEECEAAGITDSNQCRVTENRTIIVAGNGYKYRPLTSATNTYKSAVGTHGRYSSKTGLGVNWYSDIGIDYYVNGSIYASGRGYFSAYRDRNLSSVVMFCLDAQHEGYNPLYAERFLLDSSESNGVKAFDVAVMDILLGGGSSVASPVSDATITDYWARLVAIRAVEYTFGYYNAASTAYTGAFHANLSAINTWLNEDSSHYDALYQAMGGYISPRSTFTINTSSYFSGAAMETAKNYYFHALDAAVEYLNNLDNLADVDTDTILPEPTEVEVEERPEGDFVSKDVVHTITVSGLPANDQNEFVINGLKFENDEMPTGLTAYIKSIKIGDYIELETSNEGQDLEVLFGNNLLGLNYNLGSSDVIDFTEPTTIEITVHFEGYETANDGYSIETLKCGEAPIKYYIDGSYTSPEFGEYSNYVAVIWYNNRSNTQRYLSIEKAGDNGTGETWISEYETYLIDACDCDDLIDACIASSDYYSDECDELREADCGECAELEIMCHYGVTSSEHPNPCDEYGAVCEVECPTTVDNFNCCDVNNNLVISPLDDWEVNIEGPKDGDIYTCFVSQIDGQVDLQGDGVGAENVGGAVDDVGNDYTLDQNRYCVVSCKEDYYMTMPTAKLVNAGRYFTFKAEIDGTKTCYTNTIDRDLYNEDIIDIQEKMVNKYNEYKTWYQLAVEYNYGLDDDEYVSGCPGSCCGSKSYTTYHPTWNSTATVDDWGVIVDRNYDTGVLEVEYVSRNVSNSGEFTYEHPTGLSSDYVSSGCCGGCSSCEPPIECSDCSGYMCSYYTGTEYDHPYESQYYDYLMGIAEEKAQELAALQEEYNNIIKEYNKCSEWETELQYDEENPHVYYDYEESYLDDLANGYGEMTSVISNKNTSEWYCNSQVTDYSGVETLAELSSSGNSGIDYESCSLRTPSSQQYTTINYVYCDTNGCGRNKVESAQDISDARYKKVTSTVEADYVPATLFYNIYPSGEIVSAEDYESSGRDDGVAIENGLPVSLSTRRGIYKYTVNIESLGEFYENGSAFENPSNGDPGRLIASDRDDNAVINKDEYGEFVDENGTVQYACSYLVNMGITDEDTIVCDFDTECTGDDCIADCIGPNCDYECDGEDCIADCIGAGCIYDSDAGTSLIERVVSLSNLFPNGTNSYNWNRDMNEKAEVTIDEIQDAGNAVYSEDPILSVTITPSVARAIKQYNDDAEAYGGYSNSTLSCYALDGYEEIACYSSFITGLLDGYVEYDGVNYINNIDVVNDRSLVMGNNYRTVRDNNTEYFTTWSTGISEEDMIGPSWK